MAKTRMLADIKTKEVSFVDKPANKRAFLFYKRKGKDVLQKAKNIKINIEISGGIKHQ